ncbi:UNVERIFIED_ORG: hypothetical protein J2W66_001970 [Agrobacterium larrymoorei]|nr:hypothetical protein [Agrobacterium larrymoorei]
MAKQDDYARYTIRVPKEVYSAVEMAAEQNGRSLNAEIVDRLAFSVAHPAEEWEELSIAVQVLTGDLKRAEEKLEAVIRHADVLSAVSDQEFDYQLRMMYQVLNYLDEIPVELAIWAFDIIAAIERNQFTAQFNMNDDLSAEEIRDIIRHRREARRREVLTDIRKHLAGEDSEND